jgi:hypothetical protein
MLLLTMICRYCNANLGKGDIFKILKEMYGYSDAHALRAAKSYGWTPENKLQFSREVIIQFDDRNKPQVIICPDCKGISPTDQTAPTEYLLT